MHQRVGKKRVSELQYGLYSDPDFKLTFDEMRDLLTIAAHFFETHYDDGSPKEKEDA